MKTGFCAIHGNLTEENAYLCITKYVKQGWRLRCKECTAISKQRAYERHHEKHLEYSREYSKNNREKIKAWKREDRRKNPEKYRIWNKDQYKKGLEKGGSFYRLSQRLLKYKLTLDDYCKLVETQNNKCAICGNEETRKSTKSDGEVSPLAIDHCHKTNKVRGLLCRVCNLGIGSFNDDIEIMKKAINYLIEHTE